MKLLSLARRKRHYQPDEKARSPPHAQAEPVRPPSFRLLQLPPELRLIIYGYVFDVTEIRLAPDRGHDVGTEHQHLRYDYIPLRLRKVGQQPPDLIGLGGVSNSSLPALLAVCRQVRREALPLFHSHVSYPLGKYVLTIAFGNARYLGSCSCLGPPKLLQLRKKPKFS
jgi:2EXR family